MLLFVWYEVFFEAVPKIFDVIIPADKIPFQYCKFVFPCLNKEGEKTAERGMVSMYLCL